MVVHKISSYLCNLLLTVGERGDIHMKNFVLCTVGIAILLVGYAFLLYVDKATPADKISCEMNANWGSGMKISITGERSSERKRPSALPEADSLEK